MKTLFTEFGWDEYLNKEKQQLLRSHLLSSLNSKYITLKKCIIEYFDESVMKLKKFPSVIRYASSPSSSFFFSPMSWINFSPLDGWPPPMEGNTLMHFSACQNRVKR